MINKGLTKTDQRCSIELELDNTHLNFYEFITNIDDFNIVEIQKNSHIWFKQEFPLDVVEEFYKSPVKMARNKKAPSLKIKIPLSKGTIDCGIYNKNNQMINYSQIKDNCKILTVLHFYGLRFLKQQVICEWMPMQIKIFDDSIIPENNYLIDDSLLSDIEDNIYESNINNIENNVDNNESNVVNNESNIDNEGNIDNNEGNIDNNESNIDNNENKSNNGQNNQENILNSNNNLLYKELNDTQQSNEDSRLISIDQNTNNELIDSSSNNLENEVNILNKNEINLDENELLSNELNLEDLEENNIDKHDKNINYQENDELNISNNDEVNKLKDIINIKNERIELLENKIRELYKYLTNN